MKRIFIIVVLTLVTYSFAAAQNVASSQLERELRQVRKQLFDAKYRVDKAALVRLLSDDYIQFGWEGKKTTKAEFIASAPPPEELKKFKIEETLSDVLVRDYGDVALLNYIVDTTIEGGGEKISDQFRITNIYRRRNGQWQLVSTHSTKIPKTTNPSTDSKAVSLGVVNGKATKLVAPSYPEAAKAVRATGTVNVSVIIDEDGNVVSTKAESGHPLLRQAAEEAAHASKFTPTIMSGQKVKVTGIIVYNFTAP